MSSSETEPLKPGVVSVRSMTRLTPFHQNIFLFECFLILSGYLLVLLSSDAAQTCTANATRTGVLAAYGVVYIFRLLFMSHYLLPRELSIEEITVVPLWISSILCSFAFPSRTSTAAFPLSLLVPSLFLYLFGSYLNTFSELQRKRWKSLPSSTGRCYTLGLFSFSRNINYLGDVLLFGGWAFATPVWWNVWVPLVMGLSFHFHHIGDKEKYLAERYGEEWEEYCKGTKSFIPYVC